jgi:hypothetical protein
MFRFWNPILQILTALILTITINLIAKYLRALFSKPVKQFFRHLGMSSMLKTLWLWVIVAVIAVFGIFFQIPNDSIKSFFNLNDSSAYLTYDEMPVDLQNNYKQDTIYSIKLDNDLEGEISDFYYDEEYLYLYTNRSEFLIISNDTSEIIYRTKTEGTLAIDGSYDYLYDEYNNYFDGLSETINLVELQTILNDMVIVMENIDIEHLSYKAGKYVGGMTGKKYEGVEVHMKFKIDESLCFNDKWVYSLEGVIRDKKMDSLF